MKTYVILPVVLVAIIAILISALVYQIHQKNQGWKSEQKFRIAVFDALYQNLDHGDVDAAKGRLGALVTVQLDYYEQKYGQETDTNFAPRLAEARVIEAAHKVWISQLKSQQK